MESKMQPAEPKVRIAPGGPRRVKGGIKPPTVINVKPYTLIFKEKRLLCGGERQLPLVFDTINLAQLFASANDLEVEDCEYREMQLEELAHMCHDPRVHFDRFYLLDHKSQINL